MLPKRGHGLSKLQELVFRVTYQFHKDVPLSSPFAQSLSNFLNFKLSVERSTQPLPLQDVLLQP